MMNDSPEKKVFVIETHKIVDGVHKIHSRVVDTGETWTEISPIKYRVPETIISKVPLPKNMPCYFKIASNLFKRNEIASSSITINKIRNPDAN